MIIKMTIVIDNKLKYLSIILFILSPNLTINNDTRKKRADLLTVEAKRNNGNEMLKAPAVIVNNL